MCSYYFRGKGEKERWSNTLNSLQISGFNRFPITSRGINLKFKFKSIKVQKRGHVKKRFYFTEQ